MDLWYLQEGEVDSPRRCSSPATGTPRRCCTSTPRPPLHADDGTLIADEQWGVYFKPDRDSIQGGAQPLTVEPEFAVDPYPTGTMRPGLPGHVVGLAVALPGALRGRAQPLSPARSGGVGAFTADNFPVFDQMRDDVFVAADSNHGYKMIAVGKEIARVLGASTLRCCPRSAQRFATAAAPGLAQPLSLELSDRYR